MDTFAKRFAIDASPVAVEGQSFTRGNVRFTVITPCLLRVEVQKKGLFCDEATQSVWFRDFDAAKYEVKEDGDEIEIKTTKANFLYSLKGRKMLRIKLRDGRTVTDYKSGNLKGTCRTLDITAGIITLTDGVCSKNGVAVLDDSDTLVMKKDGTILPRDNKESDIYFFAYGYDYIGATTDLYKLTGKVPLIPRYALSNWWSRYKAYTQEEYLDLMDRFKEEEVPITVATVDMDWHWVNIKEKFGKDSHKVYPHKNFMEYVYDVWSTGWTGYSFNTDLFPDPEGFLKKLKDDGYHTTFNIHPSMGVRWFENQYEEMCKAMGQNPADKEPVKFDITDKKFTECYFDILHHPFEKMGVDFWWIDWQQGTHTNVPGLDPLWALNHYHFLDNAKDNHRPLILSRFCGAGSQRYPLGFSGDTTQTWKSLDFQPGFTATASNVAYPWWSHDIGGHCMGKKDDELYLRWVQLGIFSPVNRLHSTNNEFAGKEPWNYSGPVERIAKDALRLRHKLLPYIYTMNYRTHTECRAICEPMYYAYPTDESAYNCKNQFFFGSELMVAPITSKINPKTNLACVEVWLPEGRWTDIYTGAIYEGNRMLKIYRGIESIPVFAKEGAIIPMATDNKSNICTNPKDMTVRIYRGNNSFELYEDDGETNEFRNGNFAITKYTVKEEDCNVSFTVSPAEGNCSSLPQRRNYTFVFEDITGADTINVTVNGKDAKAEIINAGEKIKVLVKSVSPKANVEISLVNTKIKVNRDKKEAIIELVTKYQLPVAYKRTKFNSFLNNLSKIPSCDECFRGPLNEILEMK